MQDNKNMGFLCKNLEADYTYKPRKLEVEKQLHIAILIEQPQKKREKKSAVES